MQLDTYKYVFCRTLGHAWDPEAKTDLTPPLWGTAFDLLCTRCGTIRRDIIDVHGYLGARYYVYPQDYHLFAEDTPTREEFRLLSLDRLGKRPIPQEKNANNRSKRGGS